MFAYWILLFSRLNEIVTALLLPHIHTNHRQQLTEDSKFLFSRLSQVTIGFSICHGILITFHLYIWSSLLLPIVCLTSAFKLMCTEEEKNLLLIDYRWRLSSVSTPSFSLLHSSTQAKPKTPNVMQVKENDHCAIYLLFGYLSWIFPSDEKWNLLKYFIVR